MTPTLKAAMAAVMGTNEMTSVEVLEALTARGWEPKSSDALNIVNHRLNSVAFERVARGQYRVVTAPPMVERPVQVVREKPLREAMVEVMGGETMTSPQILTALTERGWAPNAKGNQHFVSQTLRIHPEWFERVGHGKYKARTKRPIWCPSRQSWCVAS